MLGWTALVLPVAAAHSGVKGAAYALAVLAVAVVACAYLVFFIRLPGAVLLGYAATRPLVSEFVNGNIFGGSTGRVGKVWSIGLLVLVVAYLARRTWEWRKGSRRRDRLRGLDGRALWSFGPPIALIVAYFAFTLPRANVHSAVTFGGRLATWLLLALAVGVIAKTPRGQLVTFIAGCVFAVLTIVTIGHAIMVNQYGSTYYFGTYSTPFSGQKPFGLSALAVLIAPFVLLAIMWKRSLLLAWALFVLLTAAVLLSYVRDSYLAFGIVLAAFLVIGLLRRSATAYVAAGVCAVAGVIGSTVLSSYITNRFTQGSGRLKYWSPVWHGMIGNTKALLVGKGAGASIVMIVSATGIPAWPHNDFLEMWVVGGIPLLLLYMLFVIWLGWHFVRLVRDEKQSQLVRDFAIVGLAAWIGFIALSIGFGITFSLSALPMALLVGLARGMGETPGATFLDRETPEVTAERPAARVAPART